MSDRCIECGCFLSLCEFEDGICLDCDEEFWKSKSNEETEELE
ncbi:hypothetical protein [Leptospira bandrabouensis]|nr:hypothetical protein [Leptospira bandrabouensis]